MLKPSSSIKTVLYILGDFPFSIFGNSLNSKPLVEFELFPNCPVLYQTKKNSWVIE